jgi:hypothetical protein
VSWVSSSNGCSSSPTGIALALAFARASGPGCGRVKRTGEKCACSLCKRDVIRGTLFADEVMKLSTNACGEFVIGKDATIHDYTYLQDKRDTTQRISPLFSISTLFLVSNVQVPSLPPFLC